MGDSNPLGGPAGTGHEHLDRRTVLKGIGAGALASVAMVGTASAHEVTGRPVFSGCNQLCVQVNGRADVLMARDTGDGQYEVGFLVDGGDLEPYPDGASEFSGEICLSTDDDDVPDGKLIGLQVEGTRWVNPNDCAQDALAAEREQLASTHPRPQGAAGDSCDGPPCEYAGTDQSTEGSEAIDVEFQDCQTARVDGDTARLDELVVHYVQCLDDGPCPDGASVTVTEGLPLTIDEGDLPENPDDWYLTMIEVRGEDFHQTAEPDGLECSL